MKLLQRFLSYLFLSVLVACTPRVMQAELQGLEPFILTPLPQEQRYIIAVPNFSVRAGSVRIAGQGLEQEDTFYKQLGSGLADIFVSEAFRSQQFRITERAELDKVLYEQDLAASGRIDPSTAASLGKITGAELLVLGSLSEFGVSITGGGGGVFGIFSGAAERVNVRISVDIRLVDATTAEILAIGYATAEASQGNIKIDILNVLKDLQAGQSGTSVIDLAVRNAIIGAINSAARHLPPKIPNL
ncbi:MAG: CsgG/HfaB family protein [Deinococcales bacterium]